MPRPMSIDVSESPRIVSREEWLAARKQLLAQEKRLTRQYDVIRAMRRDLPWVKVEKTYAFETPNGKETLTDLFAGRSQLIIRHFMFGPESKEGCVGCSFASDHVGGALAHLEHRDVTYVAVSRAPIAQIEAFRRRMGWTFKWVSSQKSDFNYDYDASFTKDQVAEQRAFYNFELRDLTFTNEDLSGLSVFYKNPAGEIFHTYSCYARGDEGGLTTYFYLDITPKGRNENGPNRNLADWVRHHDRYDVGGRVFGAGRDVQPHAGRGFIRLRRRAQQPPADDSAGRRQQ
jgi:predicted dithiol-disulfide oxidoreductase (DUF899 family)